MGEPIRLSSSALYCSLVPHAISTGCTVKYKKAIPYKWVSRWSNICYRKCFYFQMYQKKKKYPIVPLEQNALLIWKDRPDGKKGLNSPRLNRNGCVEKGTKIQKHWPCCSQQGIFLSQKWKHIWFTNTWNNYIPENCRVLCCNSALPGIQLQGFSKPTGCAQDTIPSENTGKK